MLSKLLYKTIKVTNMFNMHNNAEKVRIFGMISADLLTIQMIYYILASKMLYTIVNQLRDF